MVGVGDGVRVRVMDGVKVGRLVRVEVRVMVGDLEAVGDGPGVTVSVSVGVRVKVSLGMGVSEAVTDEVRVRLGVRVMDAVALGVTGVTVGDKLAVGVGEIQ